MQPDGLTSQVATPLGVHCFTPAVHWFTHCARHLPPEHEVPFVQGVGASQSVQPDGFITHFATPFEMPAHCSASSVHWFVHWLTHCAAEHDFPAAQGAGVSQSVQPDGLTTHVAMPLPIPAHCFEPAAH